MTSAKNGVNKVRVAEIVDVLQCILVCFKLNVD